MTESTYTVTGMTCDHCAQAVTEEVGKIDGVGDVTVDLPTGELTITGDQQPSRGDIRAAVEEAGYALSG